MKRTSASRSPDVGGWISLHVFYYGNADPLLTGWLQPTIARLRDRGEIAGHFFIRYWVEGSHIRVRLRRPATVPAEALAAVVTEGLAEFLERHPSTGRPPTLSPSAQRAHFLAEYDQATWDRRYGREATSIPLRPNNTWRWVDYEPEYARYGGEHGVELSERHFEVSSDTVLEILRSGELARTRRLGMSVQLTAMLCAAFLDDDADVAAFFAGYRDYWSRWYQLGDDPARVYGGAEQMTERLRGVLGPILAAARTESAPRSSGWLDHCRQLRRAVVDLSQSGRYVSSRGGPSVSDDPRVALRELLPSFAHMTNNRLGVTIAEEAYVAHLAWSTMSTGQLSTAGSTSETTRAVTMAPSASA